MIKCFHKAADSKFDDAYTRNPLLFLILIHRCISIRYQPRYFCLIWKDDRFLDTFFLFLGEKWLTYSYVDKSKEELEQRLIVEWKNILLDYLKKITKRLQYIIEVKGYLTKY